MKRAAALRTATAFAAGTLWPRNLGAQTAGLQTLHLASSPVDDVMPVLYAQRAGLFRSAGLDIDLTRSSSGTAVAAAVVGGAVDIGKASVGAVIAAHARGVPLAIIAPASVSVPGELEGALVVADGSVLRTAHDVTGKIIATTALNDLNAIAAKVWLDGNGGDSSLAQFVEIPAGATVAALQQGRVQAGILVKPYLNAALDARHVRLLANIYDAISKDMLYSAWIASTDYIAQHRDIVTKFQRVVAQASVYTNAHRNETVDLLAAWTGIDPQEAARTPRMTTGSVVNPAAIQPLINASAKYKVIPKPFDAREIIVS